MTALTVCLLRSSALAASPQAVASTAEEATEDQHEHTNVLIDEQSPYLLVDQPIGFTLGLGRLFVALR